MYPPPFLFKTKKLKTMARFNQNKSVSANSNGIIVSYGDANKHQFMRYQTPSHVSKIQIEGTARYQHIEEPTKFNPTQKDLFSKVVYGFKAFTKEEVEAMSERKRIDVKVRYTKARRILSKWKQDIAFSKLDKLLLFLFPKSSLIKEMSEVTGHLDDVPQEDQISFKDLQINQRQIADKLIEFGLLPQNFYSL